MLDRVERYRDGEGRSVDRDLMCNKYDFVLIDPSRLPGIDYTNKEEKVPIDQCISDLVLFLNERGIYTYGSCCGHREKDGWIQFRDGHNSEDVFELMKEWEEDHRYYKDRWHVQILCNGVRTIKIYQKRFWERKIILVVSHLRN